MSINNSLTDQTLSNLATYYVKTERKLEELVFLMENYNYSKDQELIKAIEVKNIRGLLGLISESINMIMKHTGKEEIKDIKSFCTQINDYAVELGGIGANIMSEKLDPNYLQKLRNSNFIDDIGKTVEAMFSAAECSSEYKK
ncbi:hypothetical protein [Priestia aryabhattai]